MKQTKNIFPLLIILVFPFISFSQNEWNSTSSSTANMYRKGNVAIGTSASNSTIPFVVKSSVASTGTKVLFGGTTLFGSIASSNSILQIQSGSSSSLHLIGSISATNSGNNATAFLDASANGLQLTYGTNGLATIPFIINGNGTENMRIWPSGAVGIGTGATALGTCKLVVNGLIGCRELKVTLATTWPDYVFGNNYKRLSVYEIEKFISKNKHLPYMKSEKEIGEEFNVGETQVDMLRSLEELYLIVIDLKKQNDILKEQIEKMNISK